MARDRGTLASARVAAELLAIAPALVEDLIRSGAVRTERIDGKLFVSLDDVERAARGVLR
jgi:hypothetical protein